MKKQRLRRGEPPRPTTGRPAVASTTLSTSADRRYRRRALPLPNAAIAIRVDRASAKLRNSRLPQCALAFGTRFAYGNPEMKKINGPFVIRQLGRAAFICLFPVFLPSCVEGQVPPALDARDEQAVEMALQAIKMTTHDLAFQKTNVESELILQKARTFLQQPLLLSVYGQSVASNLQTIGSLQSLAWFSEKQLELGPVMLDVEYQPIKVDADFLTNLPPPMGRAIETIANAAGEASQLLKQSLPTRPNASICGVRCSRTRTGQRCG
jgi:hypothetical protein